MIKRERTKRLLIFLLSFAIVITMMPMTASAAEQPTNSAKVIAKENQQVADIPINETNFPDPVFRNYVKTTIAGGSDTLTAQKANAVTSINLSNQNLQSLSGIGYFTELTSLACANTKLTSLDLSSNKKLTYLYCRANYLNQINTSGCTNLVSVDCDNNYLTTLNLSGCSGLTSLLCNNNLLSTLNLTGCTSLKSVWCVENKLTTLNLNGFSKLDTLNCFDNNLSVLDINGCTNLSTIRCQSNNISVLNISECTAVKELDCCLNQITYLPLNKLTNLKSLNCSSNRLLSLNLSNNTYLTGSPYISQSSRTLQAKLVGSNYVINLRDYDSTIDGSRITYTGTGTFDRSTCTFTFDKQPTSLSYTYNTGNSTAGNMSVSATVQSPSRITYDSSYATSGTVPVDSTVYQPGTQVTVAGNTGNLFKTGYKFGGWSYYNWSGSSSLQPGAKITVTRNTTLYAVWTPLDRYTVTLNGNGGKGNPFRYYYAEQGGTLPVWNRSGYKFMGWYTTADFAGDPVTSIATTDTGNKAFYAKWSKLPKPATPTKFKATPRSKSSIRVSWKQSSRATYYKVYRATSKSGKYKYVGKTTSTYKDITKLSKNKRYYFKVSAVNLSGSSKVSKAASAKTKRR